MCCAIAPRPTVIASISTSPSTGESYTYSETLELAERVARNLLAAGAVPGDRLLIMLPNCSAYILAWLGSSLAGIAKVPINTAYRGSFLEHQARTVAPRAALIDPAFAERFAESAEAVRTTERFYLAGGTAEERAAASATLAGFGLAAADWEDLLAANPGTSAIELPPVRHSDLGSIFFTSGTTGLSKGVMMPHAHMHLFADQCVSLTRLTDADVYMSAGAPVPRQQQLPGRVSGAGGGRPLRPAGAVQRQCLEPPDPRQRRHGHQLRRRDDGLRLAATRTPRRLRQRPALHLRRTHGVGHPRGVQATVRRRGVRGGLRIDRDLHADPQPLRRGPSAGRRRAGEQQLVRRSTRGSRDRRGGPCRRVGRTRGARPAIPGRSRLATTTCPRRPRRPGAISGGTRATG